MAIVLKSSILLVLLGIAGSVQGQDGTREVLLHARQSVMDTLNRLPKYVCTQTIERSRYGPDRTPSAHWCDEVSVEPNRLGRRRLSSSDRLRLDVAVSQNAGFVSEMYSWASEDHFSDRSVFDLVRDGAVSSGSFSSMLASIFGNDAASFSYQGDSTKAGERRLVEFGFRIPRERSHYSYIIRSGSEQQITVAYEGAFFVDPETSDVVRLVVRTDRLPPETGACELTQTLQYTRVSLDGAQFLLPAEARVSLIHSDGTEAENVVKYSACHEFRGESTVHYGPPPADGPSSSGKGPLTGELALLAGLPFKLAFMQKIDTATAAAGDPIAAKLKTAIRDRSSKVLVPEGAAVTGRIISVKHFYWPSRTQPLERPKTREQQPSLVIKVRLETINLGGVTYPLKARFDARFGRFAKLGGVLSPRIEIGSADAAADSDDGVFPFWDASPKYIVASGLESNWLTLGL